MANEATITSSLRVVKVNQDYQSRPPSFQGDITDAVGKGPSPGLVTATTAGNSITFSGLTTPGFCHIRNLDATNFVEYGIWDGSAFWPLGEVQAGEGYTIRIARNLGSGAFRVRANTADCEIVLDGFET